MQESTVHVNIVPGGMPVVLHISQYDVGLRQYTFTLYSTQGTWGYVSGASATLEATKPDNHAIVHNCTYNNDGTITYTVQEQLAAVVGRVWSKLVIRDTNNNVLGTIAIIWIVDPAGVTDSAIVSDSDISALQEFLAEFGTINAYKADLDSLRSLAAGVNVASTKAAMTNHNIAYVYTGSESGMVTYNWYWYNGSDWVSGGAWEASVATDTTLTTSGKAADAKATGDAIAELKSDLAHSVKDSHYNNITYLYDWVIGSIDANQDVDTSYNYAIVTNSIIEAKKPIAIFADYSTYYVTVYRYRQNGTFIKSTGWTTAGLVCIPKGAFFRIVFRKITTTTATLSLRDNISIIEMNDDGFGYGNINTTNVDFAANKNRAIQIDVQEATENMSVSSDDPSAYQFCIAYYNNAGNEQIPLSYTSWGTSKDYIRKGTFYRVILAYVGNGNIDVDNFEAFVNHFSIVPASDDDLLIEVKGIKNNLELLKARVATLEEDEVPSYYQAHIESKVSTINTLYTSDTDQFIFLTDYHANAYAQSGNSRSLMDYICANTLVNKFFNGGDVINGKFGTRTNQYHAQYAKAVRETCYYINPVSNVKSFFICGNHDSGEDYDNSDNTYVAILTADEVYENCGLMDIRDEVTVDPASPFQYYWDNPAKKIRYLVMDAELRDLVTGETYTNTWLFIADALQTMPSGYTMVAFNHIIWTLSADEPTGFIQEILNLFDAYNSRSSSVKYNNSASTKHDFTNCGGEVACLIGGHNHKDGNGTSTGGIPYILTTTDNAGGEIGGLTRTAGTVNEQAFDVFTIDTVNKTINATRIGAGSDRSFSY